MKIRLLILLYKTRSDHGVAMEHLYRYNNISRQGFQKAKAKLELEEKMVAQMSVLILEYRSKIDRRAGSRSLFYNLRIKERFNTGITRFERLLSKHQLTILPLRTRVVTTTSCLQSWNYPDLSNGLVITWINMFVVGDITYLSIGKYRYYLFCLTDVYSARIVGHHVSNRMRKQEALEAFKMWVKVRKSENIRGCIHHTDGGTQYFSALYLKHLDRYDIQISVAKDCLKNGYAEQKNGFIKYHLVPTMQLTSPVNLSKEMKRVIKNYNNRKQKNLDWKSPIEFEEAIKSSAINHTMVLHDWNTKTKAERRFY